MKLAYKSVDLHKLDREFWTNTDNQNSYNFKHNEAVFLHIPYIGSYPISLSREINTAFFVGRGLGGEGVVKLRLRNHLSRCPPIENRADIRSQEGGLT